MSCQRAEKKKLESKLARRFPTGGRRKKGLTETHPARPDSASPGEYREKKKKRRRPGSGA